ncbi:BON domain-containing protein [Candidatus Binatia bacterium]|nr:BON domain-containing protein [Candidatus Binatia bacterium]
MRNRVWMGAASLAVAMAFVGGVAACGGFVPYRKMAQAAGSLLSARAQAEDQIMQLDLRRAIMTDDALAALGISPHVYMARGFIVGRVDNRAQADALVAAAQGVTGLRSVNYYLPVAPGGATVLAEDVEKAAEIKAAIAGAGDLVVTRYDVSVVDGHAVLLGVVGSAEESAGVETAALSVDGIGGVTNFLLPVEGPYAALRPRLR